jgi:hypothetical protein
MKMNSISSGLAFHARIITTPRPLRFRRAWILTGFLALVAIALEPQPAQYYATIAYSGLGMPLWTNRYNGSFNGADQLQSKPSLAIGSDDAVYVTGASDGLSVYDFTTVKYVWRTDIAIQLLTTPPKVNLTLSAAPNSSWAIERALQPTGPWTNLSRLLIGENGSAQLQDTNPSSLAGFYRARQ